MTPRPKPLPAGVRRMRRDNPIPMTSSQYLLWLAKKPKPPQKPADVKDILHRMAKHMGLEE